METAAILFSLLRNVICGESIRENIIDACTPDKLEELYQLACKHDLAHLVAHALEKAVLPDCEALTKLKRVKSRAIYRYIRMEHVCGRVCQTLEKAGIPHIPLKGAVLRPLYPEPWMRTSSDLDVLVREEDLERAGDCLVSELGCENKGRAYHDVSFRTPDGVLLELHFILAEESYFPKAQRLVETVWEHTEPMPGRQYGRCLTAEMLFFHHILHMGYHFCAGGCGIRFLLDQYILGTRLSFDREQYARLLREGGFVRFYEAVDALAKVWFAGCEHTALTKALEDFVLSGGTFGNTGNRAAVKRVKQGGKMQAVLAQIVLPYDQLKGLYPILREKKWLTPLFQIVRWFRLLSPERFRRSFRFLRSGISVSEDTCDTLDALLREMEL